MPRLLQVHPDLSLFLAGGGQVADALMEQISALSLVDKVIMTGRVPRDQVERHYSLTDILVYPRKAMRLTSLVTQLKPLEAMEQKSRFVDAGRYFVEFERNWANSVAALIPVYNTLLGVKGTC